MHLRKAATTVAILLACAGPASAQSSGWVGIGVGQGWISQGSGLTSRLTLGLLQGRWGLGLRLASHNGEEDDRVGGAFIFGQPSEEFDEAGLLLYRDFGQGGSGRVLLGAGLGFIEGSEIDPQGSLDFVDVGPVFGVPFELVVQTGDGDGFGFSIFAGGHLNTQVSQFGAGIGVTWGFGFGSSGGEEDGPEVP